MYYEEVRVRSGETVSGLAVAYGHKAQKWRSIWDEPENLVVTAKRGKPENMKAGDVLHIPIPWRVISKTLTVKPNGVEIKVRRDGGRGSRVRWIQTVNRDNQPFGVPDIFCTDPCGPPDDNAPFYWTGAELAGDPHRRKRFSDYPKRPAPSAALGTTRWRAVLSIAVVTGKRVTVYDSWVWGFNMAPGGTVTRVAPRRATPAEVAGHLNLLRKGKGTTGATFKAQGWTFRRPPQTLGDFPFPRPAGTRLA